MVRIPKIVIKQIEDGFQYHGDGEISFRYEIATSIGGECGGCKRAYGEDFGETSMVIKSVGEELTTMKNFLKGRNLEESDKYAHIGKFEPIGKTHLGAFDGKNIEVIEAVENATVDKMVRDAKTYGALLMLEQVVPGWRAQIYQRNGFQEGNPYRDRPLHNVMYRML